MKYLLFFLSIFLFSCTSKLTNTTFKTVKEVEDYATGVETDEALMVYKKEMKNENGFTVSTVEGGYINNELVKLTENSINPKATNIFKFYLKNGQLIYSTQEEFIMNFDGNKPLSRMYKICYGDNNVLNATVKEVVSQYDREMIDMNKVETKPYSTSYSSLMKANEKKIASLKSIIDPIAKSQESNNEATKKKLERVKNGN